MTVGTPRVDSTVRSHVKFLVTVSSGMWVSVTSQQLSLLETACLAPQTCIEDKDTVPTPLYPLEGLVQPLADFWDCVITCLEIDLSYVMHEVPLRKWIQGRTNVRDPFKHDFAELTINADSLDL